MNMNTLNSKICDQTIQLNHQDLLPNLMSCIYATSNIVHDFIHIFKIYKDKFLHAPSQCETMLQGNAISHWLGTFTK